MLGVDQKAVMGQEVCSKDWEGDCSEDERKTVNGVTKLHGGGLHAPCRDGRSISRD